MPDAISSPSPLTALLRPGFVPEAGVSATDDFAQLMAGATVAAPAHDVKLPKGAAIASTAAIVATLPAIADALPSAQLIAPEGEPLPAPPPPPPPLPELPRTERTPVRQPRPAERQARADTGKTLPPGNDASPDEAAATATQTVSAPVDARIERVDVKGPTPPLARDAARAEPETEAASPALPTAIAAVPTRAIPVSNTPEKAIETPRAAKARTSDKQTAVPAPAPAFVDADRPKAAATDVERPSPVAIEETSRDESAAVTPAVPFVTPLDQPAPPPGMVTVTPDAIEAPKQDRVDTVKPVDASVVLDRLETAPSLTLASPIPVDAATPLEFGTTTPVNAPVAATLAPPSGATPVTPVRTDMKADAVTTPVGARPIDSLATLAPQTAGAPLPLSRATMTAEPLAAPAVATAQPSRQIGTDNAAATAPRELSLPSAAVLARDVRIDAPAPAAAPVIAPVVANVGTRAQPEPAHTPAPRRAASADSLPIVTTVAATPPTDKLLRARPNTAFAAEPVAADPRIAEAATLAPVTTPVRHEASITPQTPVDTTRADWMRGMIERIETIVDHPGHRETRLTLSPDALGEVAVRFRETPDGLVVALDAATPEARAMIAEAAPRLTEMAEARGLRLSMQSGTGGDATSQSNQHREPPRPQGDSPIPNRNMAKTAAKAPGDERIA